MDLKVCRPDPEHHRVSSHSRPYVSKGIIWPGFSMGHDDFPFRWISMEVSNLCNHTLLKNDEKIGDEQCLHGKTYLGCVSWFYWLNIIWTRNKTWRLRKKTVAMFVLAHCMVYYLEFVDLYGKKVQWIKHIHFASFEYRWLDVFRCP